MSLLRPWLAAGLEEQSHAPGDIRSCTSCEEARPGWLNSSPVSAAHESESASGYADSTSRSHGLIRGLWSSATQIVSYMGLPALEVNVKPNDTNRDSADARRGERALLKQVFLLWTEWRQIRAAKRDVMQTLGLLRTETLVRHHFSKWFDYCECMSGSTTPSPRTPRSLSSLTSTPRSSANGNRRASMDLRPGVPFDVVHAWEGVPGTSPRLQGEADTHTRKVKDMRPGALVQQSKMLVHGLATPERCTSAPSSPGGLQLCPIANEPCPSSPSHGAIRTSLSKSIKQLQERRHCKKIPDDVEARSPLPLSPFPSPFSTFSIPKEVLVEGLIEINVDVQMKEGDTSVQVPMQTLTKASFSTQGSSTGHSCDQVSDRDIHSYDLLQSAGAMKLVELQKCDAEGDLQRTSATDYKEQTGPSQRRAADYSVVSPSNAVEKDHDEMLPLLSRSNSADRSITQDRSLSPDVPPTEHIDGLTQEEGLAAQQQCQLELLNISWLRKDSSWRRVELPEDILNSTGIIATSNEFINRLGAPSHHDERIEEIFRHEPAAIDGNMDKTCDKFCESHVADNDNVAVLKKFTNMVRRPRGLLPNGRDLSSFYSAADEESFRCILEELTAKSRETWHPDQGDEMESTCGDPLIGNSFDACQTLETHGVRSMSNVLGLRQNSSETPSPEESQDSDEVLCEAWRLRHQSEDDDVFVMSESISPCSHTSLLSRNWPSQTSLSGSVSSTTSRRKQKSSCTGSSRSVCSVNTFTGECIDSILYEHEYKLSVRAMNVWKHQLHRARILSIMQDSRCERVLVHYLRSWFHLAEQERKHHFTISFIWRAWSHFFHMGVQDLQQASVQMRSKAKRKFIRAWHLMVLKARADNFSRGCTLYRTLHVWSNCVERQILDNRQTSFALKAWRLQHGECKVMELEAVTSADKRRAQHILDSWAAAALHLKTETLLSRSVFCAWQSRNQILESDLHKIAQKRISRDYSNNLNTWRDCVFHVKIEDAFSCILYELLCEEAECIVQEMPRVVQFCAESLRRSRYRMLHLWREYLHKVTILDRSYLLQRESTNFFRTHRSFQRWFHGVRAMMAEKIKRMNPTTNIDELEIASPCELLRKTRGDVDAALQLQQMLQVQLIQRRLGNAVSEATATDLLDHAKGNTAAALQTARDAQALGTAVEYFAKITHLSFFKMWQHVVAMEKTLMYLTVTIQQRMDFQMLSGHFAAWVVLIKHIECLWRSQLTIQEQFAHLNCTLNFRAWSDYVVALKHLKGFQLKLAAIYTAHHLSSVYSEWRLVTLQNLCFSACFKIVRGDYQLRTLNQSFKEYIYFVVVRRAEKKLRGRVCGRRDGLQQQYFFNMWSSRRILKRHRREVLLAVEDLRRERDRSCLLAAALHAWSHAVQSPKMDRVLSILNFCGYTGAQPAGRSLASKCLKRSRGNVHQAELLIREDIHREQALQITKFVHGQNVLEDASDLLARTKGSVSKAKNLAYYAVQRSMSMAHYAATKSSKTVECWKDFIYMWKAWKVMMYQADFLPAKHCFVRWAVQYSSCKARREKGLTLVSSFRSVRLGSFFLAWMSVWKYKKVLAEVKRHLRYNSARRKLGEWQLNHVTAKWHKTLHARMVQIANTWMASKCWSNWRNRWIFLILGRNIRIRFLKRNAREALAAWLCISSQLRNAQLILSRELQTYLQSRLSVWQREFYWYYRQHKCFIVSATAVALMRVQRSCMRMFKKWRNRLGDKKNLALTGRVFEFMFRGWVLMDFFCSWKELTEMLQLEKLTSVVKAELANLTLARTFKARLKEIIAHWCIHTVTIREFDNIVLGCWQNRVRRSFFIRWGASQHRLTECGTSPYVKNCKYLYFQAWSRHVLRAVWMRSQAFTHRIKAKDCMILAVMTEWYRYSAAITGLRRHYERIILSDILEEWRHTFSARRLARNIAIKCGQDSFRSWQMEHMPMGQSLASSEKLRSFALSESSQVSFAYSNSTCSISRMCSGENTYEMLQAHSFETLQLHSFEMDPDAFPVVRTADESSFGSLNARRAVAALQMEHHGHVRGTVDVQHRRLLDSLVAVDQVIDALKDSCGLDSQDSQGAEPMHNAKQQYQETPSADSPEESSSRESTPRPGINLLRRGCSGKVSDNLVPVQDDEIPGNFEIVRGLRSCICNDAEWFLDMCMYYDVCAEKRALVEIRYLCNDSRVKTKIGAGSTFLDSAVSAEWTDSRTSAALTAMNASFTSFAVSTDEVSHLERELGCEG